MGLSLLTFSPLDLCKQGDYEAAAALAGLSVGEWPKNDSAGDSGYAEAVLVAGIILSTLGDIRQSADQTLAREMLSESIRLFGDDPRSLEAQSWLVWSTHRGGDIDGAFAQAGRLLSQPLESPARFRLLLLRSSVYWCKGFTDKALAELALIEPLYDESCSWAKGVFHHHRGLLLRTQDETDRAIIEYESALHFFEEAGNIRWQACTANNLSHVYLVTEQFDRAHEYATKAERLFHQLGDKAYQAKALDQTALIYLAEGKLKEAEWAINCAEELVSNGTILEEILATKAKIKNTIPVETPVDYDNLPPQAGRSDSPPIKLTSPQGVALMSPLECASHLIQNPQDAAMVFYLLSWATSDRSNPKHEAELDGVMQRVYSQTDDSDEHRDHYRRSLLVREVQD